MLQTDNSSSSGFDSLGIASKLLSILNQQGFTTPTPIQAQSIPVALTGSDIIGIAQTGTGKTLSFGIPMLQKIAKEKCLGLVVLPTRELAIQVDESLQKIGKVLGLRTAILIGGESMGKQLSQLKRKPQVIIATPGRLIDHLEQKTVQLSNVGILVLDEADRMLDMGFMPQIKKVLAAVPVERQTMLFSATMPEAIVGIASKHMKLPVRVEVAPAGSTNKKITQELFFVDKAAKTSLLHKVLNEYSGSVLVFTRTKFGAKKVARQIRGFGISASEIHSNRSLNQRLEALNGYKSGKYRVMVATDIAARGLDVTGIELVLNYDLPDNAEDYVHRIGRTGRAGKVGHAISFATPQQKRDVKDIERLIRAQLPVTELPELQAVPEQNMNSEEREPRSQRRRPFERGRGFGNRPARRHSAKPGFGKQETKAQPQTAVSHNTKFRFGTESVSTNRVGSLDNRPKKFPKKPGGKRPRNPFIDSPIYN